MNPFPFKEECVVISLNIPRSWGTFLYSACKKEMRKRETVVSKSNFVPAPGRNDVNRIRIDAMKELMMMIKSQVDIEP